ncbi:hypothetical protein Ccel_3353 [Ruminiclostridium cellulolyticum H10]|uniref:Uncharacterized protein n=2 Tax=Ruminiclostridium cellulolyticum TaxID=1521 RepID=B8I1K7_RUMCH|nr:hypothetical protein Ccel_3353 [Ruminiclostridium cellulolyticum H10]
METLSNIIKYYKRAFILGYWVMEAKMADTHNVQPSQTFETIIKEYLHQGKEKLEKDLAGTREAIKLIARDKTRNFMRTMDMGLNEEERDCLHSLIVTSMYQSFCYGYGIGKIEGETKQKVCL